MPGKYIEPRPCERCGIEFQPKHVRIRFCSYKCARSTGRQFDLKPCEQCGTVYQPKAADSKSCSRRCGGLARRKYQKPVPQPCEWCETVYQPKTGSRIRFCSLQCSYASAAANRIIQPEMKCERCGVTFRPKQVKHSRFCTKACASKRLTDAVAHLAHTTCGYCGVEFSWTDHPGRLHRFCSNSCHFNAARKYVSGNCLNCGEPARDARVTGKLAGSRKYCTDQCRRVYEAARKARKQTCATCGVVFVHEDSSLSRVRQRYFCGPECRLAGRVTPEATRLRHLAKENQRRALKRQTAAENVDYREIERRDQFRCYLCRRRIAKRNVHFDHVIPLSRGGEHSARNIRMTHRWCNLRKHARLITHQPFMI